MPRLKNMNIQEVKEKVGQCRKKYIRDWNHWINVKKHAPNNISSVFGETLRKWQACRPNTPRRDKNESSQHDPPYLDDLIEQAKEYIAVLNDVEMLSVDCINRDVKVALHHVWDIFKDLSYKGKSRKGLAGVVGISKAVLLLTEGRIGPAFDSEVRNNLGIKQIDDPIDWICELKDVAQDINDFENRNGCLLTEIMPSNLSGLNHGRIYDMIFGPKE